jgi:hypothetical protein
MPDARARSGHLVQVWGTAPETGAVSFFQDDAGYLIRVHGIADFLMSANGAELRCHPLPDALAPWEPVFRQQVLPLQRAQQGQPVFHGGAVCRGDHAVVLLGPSGQGKSTLTAACASSGMAFLTDDCLVLREGTPVMVVPDQDHVRVWADSYAALGGNAPDDQASDWIKPRLQADALSLPHRPEPAQLACMIVLEGESDDIVLERLSPADATMAWRSNAFVVDLRAPQVLRDTMQRAARLAQAVPAYKLKYPRSYTRLPEVVAAVSACLDAVLAGKAT